MQKRGERFALLGIFIVFIIFLSTISIAATQSSIPLPQPQPPSDDAIAGAASRAVSPYLSGGSSENNPPQDTNIALKPKSTSKLYNAELTQPAPADNSFFAQAKGYLLDSTPSWSWLRSLIPYQKAKGFSLAKIPYSGEVPNPNEKLNVALKYTTTLAEPIPASTKAAEPPQVAALSTPISLADEGAQPTLVASSNPSAQENNKQLTTPPAQTISPKTNSQNLIDAKINQEKVRKAKEEAIAKYADLSQADKELNLRKAKEAALAQVQAENKQTPVIVAESDPSFDQDFASLVDDILFGNPPAQLEQKVVQQTTPPTQTVSIQAIRSSENAGTLASTGVSEVPQSKLTTPVGTGTSPASLSDIALFYDNLKSIIIDGQDIPLTYGMKPYFNPPTSEKPISGVYQYKEGWAVQLGDKSEKPTKTVMVEGFKTQEEAKKYRDEITSGKKEAPTYQNGWVAKFEDKTNPQEPKTITVGGFETQEEANQYKDFVSQGIVPAPTQSSSYVPRNYNLPKSFTEVEYKVDPEASSLKSDGTVVYRDTNLNILAEESPSGDLKLYPTVQVVDPIIQQIQQAAYHPDSTKSNGAVPLFNPDTHELVLKKDGTEETARVIGFFQDKDGTYAMAEITPPSYYSSDPSESKPYIGKIPISNLAFNNDILGSSLTAEQRAAIRTADMLKDKDTRGIWYASAGLTDNVRLELPTRIQAPPVEIASNIPTEPIVDVKGIAKYDPSKFGPEYIGQTFGIPTTWQQTNNKPSNIIIKMDSKGIPSLVESSDPNDPTGKKVKIADNGAIIDSSNNRIIGFKHPDGSLDIQIPIPFKMTMKGSSDAAPAASQAILLPGGTVTSGMTPTDAKKFTEQYADAKVKGKDPPELPTAWESKNKVDLPQQEFYPTYVLGSKIIIKNPDGTLSQIPFNSPEEARKTLESMNKQTRENPSIAKDLIAGATPVPPEEAAAIQKQIAEGQKENKGNLAQLDKTIKDIENAKYDSTKTKLLAKTKLPDGSTPKTLDDLIAARDKLASTIPTSPNPSTPDAEKKLASPTAPEMDKQVPITQEDFDKLSSQIYPEHTTSAGGKTYYYDKNGNLLAVKNDSTGKIDQQTYKQPLPSTNPTDNKKLSTSEWELLGLYEDCTDDLECKSGFCDKSNGGGVCAKAPTTQQPSASKEENPLGNIDDFCMIASDCKSGYCDLDMYSCAEKPSSSSTPKTETPNQPSNPQDDLPSTAEELGLTPEEYARQQASTPKTETPNQPSNPQDDLPSAAEEMGLTQEQYDAIYNPTPKTETPSSETFEDWSFGNWLENAWNWLDNTPSTPKTETPAATSPVDSNGMTKIGTGAKAKAQIPRFFSSSTKTEKIDGKNQRVTTYKDDKGNVLGTYNIHTGEVKVPAASIKPQEEGSFEDADSKADLEKDGTKIAKYEDKTVPNANGIGSHTERMFYDKDGNLLGKYNFARPDKSYEKFTPSTPKTTKPATTSSNGESGSGNTKSKVTGKVVGTGKAIYGYGR